ncbi:MAG: DNA-binding response regulator [Gammaproteobacteria bacterium]
MIDIVVLGNDPGIKQSIEKAGKKVSVISDEVQALMAAKDLSPGFFFLPYDFRKGQTPEFVSLLRRASQASKVVLIGRNVSDEIIIECLVKGALGYIETAELPKFIDKMINTLQAGEVWITRRLTAKIIERLQTVF